VVEVVGEEAAAVMVTGAAGMGWVGCGGRGVTGAAVRTTVLGGGGGRLRARYVGGAAVQGAREAAAQEGSTGRGAGSTSGVGAPEGGVRGVGAGAGATSVRPAVVGVATVEAPATVGIAGGAAGRGGGAWVAVRAAYG